MVYVVTVTVDSALSDYMADSPRPVIWQGVDDISDKAAVDGGGNLAVNLARTIWRYARPEVPPARHVTKRGNRHATRGHLVTPMSTGRGRQRQVHTDTADSAANVVRVF